MPIEKIKVGVRVDTHNAALEDMIQFAARSLVTRQGISRDAAKLLITASELPERIRTEAALHRPQVGHLPRVPAEVC